MARHYVDWLDAFVQYASLGEAPLEAMYWVGVSTIAGALRRKVWIDEIIFQWLPNFYIVLVAEPGIVSKTTTANIGFELLREVEGINFGPDMTTWQALIEAVEGLGETFELDGLQYPMSAMTVAIDELGTFIDPDDRSQIDALVALYDCKRGDLKKLTKSQGSNTLSYPWINIFACTTPTWINSNFPDYFLGSGFMSRVIFVMVGGKRHFVPYPSRRVQPTRPAVKAHLVSDLRQIAGMAGAFQLTPEAFEWGEAWYKAHWTKYANGGKELLGYPARAQTHMHKLAMVISASRGEFPLITEAHLIEADSRLRALEGGMSRVSAIVGTQGLTRAADDIVEAVKKAGGTINRRELFRKYFFRRLSNREFEEALKATTTAGLLTVLPEPQGIMVRAVGQGAPPSRLP